MRPFFVGVGFALLSVVWGTQYLVIRIGQERMPALLSASLRFAILAVVAAVAARCAGARAPRGAARARLAFGATQALCFGLLYWAQKSVPSSVAGVLASTSPLFVAALAHGFVAEERLRPPTAIALVLGFAGAAGLVIGSGSSGDVSIAPMLLILVGELAGASNKVLAKRLVADVPTSILLRDMGATVAGATLLAWLVFERSAPTVWSPRTVLPVVYLAVVASAGASTLYLWLLRSVRVTTLGYLQFTTALVAAITGVLVGGERGRPAMVFGAAGVIAGLAVLAHGRAAAR